MEPDIIKTVGDFGQAGASIVMAVVFIRYLQQREKEWLSILGNHMSEEIKAFTSLTENIREMRNEIKDKKNG